MKEGGFTLIEVLAALTVFSIAALGLIHINSENTSGTRLLENRFLASTVVDNEMVSTLLRRETLEDGVTSGVVELAGREWEWQKSISTTPNPLLQEITINVWEYTSESEPVIISSLKAYRGKN